MEAFSSLGGYTHSHLGSTIGETDTEGELLTWKPGCQEKNSNPGAFLLRAPVTFYSLNKSFLPLFR